MKIYHSLRHIKEASVEPFRPKGRAKGGRVQPEPAYLPAENRSAEHPRAGPIESPRNGSSPDGAMTVTALKKAHNRDHGDDHADGRRRPVRGFGESGR
jgi:hypothetical protein